MWCGIVGNHFFVPSVSNGKLNGPKYLEILKEVVDPYTTVLVFEHDGAPPNFELPGL